MHLLDIILLVLLIAAVVRGAVRGAVDQLISIGALVVAFAVASPFSRFVVEVIPYLQGRKELTWFVSFALLFVGLVLLLKFFFYGVKKVFSVTDRVIGGVVAFIMAATILSILLNLYSTLAPQYGWTMIPDDLVVYPVIRELTRSILPDFAFNIGEIEIGNI